MNTKIKKVFLHIGLPKTATTSLQKSLLKNKELLLKTDGGYLYPEISHMHHGVFIFSKFSKQPQKILHNFRKFNNNSEITKYLKKEQKIFENQVLESNCENLIISGEQIHVLDKEWLILLKQYILNLAPNCEIKIVLCTREHTSMACSTILQHLKVGKKIEFDDIIKKNFTIYQATTSKFIDVFSKGNIIIYKFEDAVKHIDGPIGMFLQQINVSADDFELVNIMENKGYSDKTAELLQYINNILPIISYSKHVNGRYWGDTSHFAYISGSKYKLKKDSIEEIHKLSFEDKKWLKTNFGIDYTGTKIKNNSNEVIFDNKFYSEYKLIYRMSNNVINKLCYDYFTSKVNESELSDVSRKTFQNILRWMDNENFNFKNQDLEYFISNVNYKNTTKYKFKRKLYLVFLTYKQNGLNGILKKIGKRVGKIIKR